MAAVETESAERKVLHENLSAVLTEAKDKCGAGSVLFLSDYPVSKKGLQAAMSASEKERPPVDSFHYKCFQHNKQMAAVGMLQLQVCGSSPVALGRLSFQAIGKIPITQEA